MATKNNEFDKTIQDQLAEAIQLIFEDIVIKKINIDHFLDIHIPEINEKKGTHLFFNTAKDQIKIGFYCRDQDFINEVVSRELDSIEVASNGLRIKGNPILDNVNDATEAALNFLGKIKNDHFFNSDRGETKSETVIGINDETIDAFVSKFGTDDLSGYLENFLKLDKIVVLSISGNGIETALEQNVYYSEYVRWFGEVEMNNWEGLSKIIGKSESDWVKNEFTAENPSGIVLLYCDQKYVYAFSNPNDVELEGSDDNDSNKDYDNYFENSEDDESNTELEDEAYDNYFDNSNDELIEDNASLKIDKDTIPQILAEINADKKLKHIEISYYINDYSDLNFGLIYKVNNCNVEVNRVNWYNDSYWTGEINREDLIEGLTEYLKGNINGLELYESYIHSDDWKFDRAGTLDNGVEFSITDLNGLTDIPKNLQDEDGELDVWELSNYVVPEEEDLYDENKGWTFSYEFSINGKTYGQIIDRSIAVDNDAIMAARWKEETPARITLLFDSLLAILSHFHTRGSNDDDVQYFMVEFENITSSEIILSNTKILDKVRKKVMKEWDEKGEEEWIERYCSAYEILDRDFNLVSEINTSLIKLSRMPEEDSGECDFSILSNLNVPLTIFPISEVNQVDADDHQVLFSTETSSEISKFYDSIDTSFESFQIFIVSNANLYGVLDLQGEQLIDCVYERIVPINSKKYWCLLDGYWLLLDKQSKVLTKVNFDDLVYALDDLCYARLGNSCGLINDKGEEVVPVIFDNILPFSNDLTAVFVNGSYIFYNKFGERKAFPNIERIGVDNNSGNWLVNDGIINVRVNGNFCYLNTDGDIIGNYFAPILFNFSDGYVSIGDENTRAVMDTKGNVYFKNQFDYIIEIQNGLFSVIKDDSYGVINIEGKIIVPIKYDYLYFNEGKYIICDLNGKQILYDWTGRIILDLVYDTVTLNPSIDINESDKAWLNLDNDGMRGFYNIETKKIIECEYDDSIGGFDNGVVTVEKDEKYGYLDTNGKLIGGQFFDAVAYQEDDFSFKENISYVKKGEKYAFLSIDGTLQTKFIYNSASLFQDGYAIVSDKNDLFGVINTQFNYVIDCKYDSVERIGESKILFVAQYEGNYGIIDSNDDIILEFKFNEINPINNNLTICNLTKNFMTKRTEKWEKDFEKRYSNAIKELQSLENEYKKMQEDNSDVYWFSLYPDESSVEFGDCNNYSVRYVKENQYEEGIPEHVSVTLSSELGSFNFDFNSLNQLKSFRNDIIAECDKMSRDNVSVSINTDECEEDDEDWENNEEQEYTIQCSRSCVQTWTHTVMARSTCEAYRKAKEGEGHDGNDDFDDYGDIDYESI